MHTASRRLHDQRHYGLDWLRAGAFILLIFYHVGMAFVPWDWHVKADHIVSWAVWPMRAVNPWRLLLLFVVSGFATAHLLDKRGAAGRMMRERLTFLGLPLLFGMLVVVPPQSWAEVREKGLFSGDFLSFYLDHYLAFDWRFGIILPTWNHLWYLAYLLAYIAVAAALVGGLPQARRSAWCRRWAGLLGGWRLPATAFGALLTARLLLGPLFPVTHALVDDWYAHAQFAGAFTLGWLIARERRLLEDAARIAGLLLLLGIAAFAMRPLVEGLAGGLPPLLRAGLDAPFFCAQQAAIPIALIGFAHRYWNRDNGLRRYLTAAVFCWYVLHQTIIVLTVHALKGTGLPALQEFILVTAATVAGCLAGYELLRRVPGLRVLVGIRPPDGREQALRRQGAG
ncbi:MAG: acyltransferase [Alphaproteobacteria bacterium]|nr:MAG: acyltransferase [Alphaproteobacteria bacterium]